MLRNYFFINLFLIIIIGFLGFKLFNAFASYVDIPVEAKIVEGKKEDIKVKHKEKIASEASFKLITDQDLFRPSRSAPSIKKEKIEKVAAPKNTPRLFGTVILGDNKTAILEDPETKTTKTYRVNESVSGFVVSEILEDKVVLLSGSEKVEVRLRDDKGIKSKRKPKYKPRSRRQTQRSRSVSRRKPQPRRPPRSHSSQKQINTPPPNPAGNLHPEVEGFMEEKGIDPSRY
jgi:hypothetical protein